MGKGSTGGERATSSELEEFVSRVREYCRPAAIILHGSHGSGMAGDWSDIDVIVISETFEGTRLFDRIGELLKFTRGKIEPLAYTPSEFISMTKRMNPLAINALLLGRPLEGAEFFREAKAIAESFKLVRRGRMWISPSDPAFSRKA